MTPPKLLIINLYHALQPEQLEALADLLAGREFHVVDVLIQFQVSQPYEEQIKALVGQCADLMLEKGAAPENSMIIPPAQNFITAGLLAYWHGLFGFFPSVVRIGKREGGVTPEFKIAEIMNLDDYRNQARQLRK